MAKAEIIIGKTDGSFAPTATIDKSSCATMLSKMYAIVYYPGNEILFYIRDSEGKGVYNANVYIYFENENAPADKFPEDPITTDHYGLISMSTSSTLEFTANVFAEGYRQGLTANKKVRDNFVNIIEMKADENLAYTSPISGFNKTAEWSDTEDYLERCQNFGWRYGVTSEIDFHQGIDIPRSKGTPVYSSSNGKTVKAGEYGACGKLVQIEHCYYDDSVNDENDKKYYFIFQHLNTISVDLGVPVTQGQQIGTVGNTGGNYGYHLHFSVSNSDAYGTTSRQYMDPLAFIANQTPYYN